MIKKRFFERLNLQQMLLVFLLIAVVIIFTVINSRFASPSNVINIVRKMSESMILAVGMTFCLISGGIDLSVGRTGIMAGIIAGLIMKNMSVSYPEFATVSVAILVGLASGAVIGFINGVIISKLKVTAFIATLGTMTIAYGVSLLLTGGHTITNLPESFLKMGTGFIFKNLSNWIEGIQGIPFAAVIMIIVVAISQVVLKKTEFGLNIYAIGGNFNAAKLAGLRNDRILIIIYTLTGVLSALAGMILTARVVSAQPGLWGDINLEVIAGCIIGGTSLAGGSGSVIASFFGILLMTMIGTGLNIAKVEYSWQQVLIGLIILIAVSVDMLSKKNKN